jgi:hypothetical protein
MHRWPLIVHRYARVGFDSVMIVVGLCAGIAGNVVMSVSTTTTLVYIGKTGQTGTGHPLLGGKFRQLARFYRSLSDSSYKHACVLVSTGALLPFAHH